MKCCSYAMYATLDLNDLMIQLVWTVLRFTLLDSILLGYKPSIMFSVIWMDNSSYRAVKYITRYNKLSYHITRVCQNWSFIIIYAHMLAISVYVIFALHEYYKVVKRGKFSTRSWKVCDWWRSLVFFCRIFSYRIDVNIEMFLAGCLWETEIKGIFFLLKI